MASSHPSYPSPGPSSYYHPPPPPPQFYANGPGSAPYYNPYMPPMNGHTPMHQPASPRISSPNRGRYNPQRGGMPGYHQYHHMPPPPHNLHPGAGIQSSPISPVNPYPHPQKYSPHIPQVSYSPSYHTQPNGAYHPGWSQPPPPPKHMLSPVMQSSVPVPGQPQQQLDSVSLPQLSTAPHPQPDPRLTVSISTHQPAPVPPETSASELPVSGQNPTEAALSPETINISQVEPVHPSPVPEETDLSATVSTDTQLPIVVYIPEQEREPPMTQFMSLGLTHKTTGPSDETRGWVVWSRRPQDPAHAPGVIISTGAFPPDVVVHKALDLHTPPMSPKALSVPLNPAGLPAFEEHPTDNSATAPLDAVKPPSSSVTESTPTSSTPGETPVPGSPATSRTSVSLPATSSGKIADDVNFKEAKEVTVSTSDQDSSATVYVAPSAPAPQVQQATALVLAAKPAVKRSWASLLQSSDSAASSSKSRLPTSAVVGFSIPAAATAGSSVGGVAGTAASPHRNELLKLLNNGLPPANTPPKIQPRGLINSGNMCFANAVLQTLVYCQPFNRLFSELSKYLTGPVVGSQKEGTKATPLVDAIIQFMEQFVPEPTSDAKNKGKERDDFYEPEAFIPSYVYDAMKEKKRFASMIGGYQEDAEEFLGFFLDTLEEELLSFSSSLQPNAVKHAEGPNSAGSQDDAWFEVGKKNRAMITRTVRSTESPITRIFGGKFRSILRAPHQKDSVTVEDWRSLRLDIQRETTHTIKDALQCISQPQPVQISQPTRPGVIVEATQQALIEFLPPILVLHLKRFHYDTSVGDVVKIGKQVSYGPELDISPELITPTKRTAHPVRYQLFGVLYHHGQSASGGHYTLDVLHPNRDMSDCPRAAWIRIDDELVSDIRLDDVFGGQEQNDRCAYLLFYRRLGTWGPART